VKFALVHLSGHMRGETQYFDRPWLSLGSDPVNDVVFSPDGSHPVSPAHAELFQTDCDMRLRNRDPAVGVLLNDVQAEEAILADKDIIQLGPRGPKLRFRIRPGEYAACKLTREILEDARAVAAEAQGEGRGSFGSFVGQLAYDLRRHASRTTQVAVVGLLVLILSVVAGAIYSGYKTRKVFERQMTALTQEIESSRLTQADLERRIAEARAKAAEALAARQAENDRLVAQLREMGIRSEVVLEAIKSTPRHIFIDEALASRAYDNTALPIGHNQTISQPYIVARMVETLLEGQLPEKVLEVGTGCGYQTAILSKLVKRVYSIERIEALLAKARERFRALKCRNIRAKYGDGNRGWPEHAPYDGIIVSAAPMGVPAQLLKQLQVNGKLIIPVGRSGEQQLLSIFRTEDGFEEKRLDWVSFVPMIEGVG